MCCYRVLESYFVFNRQLERTDSIICFPCELLCFFYCMSYAYPLFCVTGLTMVFNIILQPHLRNVVEYMLLANKDTDDEVALEACEFWYSPYHLF